MNTGRLAKMWRSNIRDKLNKLEMIDGLDM
jgi:hypothetical protein